MYIVIFEDIYIGPFDSELAAETYAKSVCTGPYAVVELNKPYDG